MRAEQKSNCRLPTGDTADCQSALRGGLRRLVSLELAQVVDFPHLAKNNNTMAQGRTFRSGNDAETEFNDKIHKNRKKMRKMSLPKTSYYHLLSDKITYSLWAGGRTSPRSKIPPRSFLAGRTVRSGNALPPRTVRPYAAIQGRQHAVPPWRYMAACGG